MEGREGGPELVNYNEPTNLWNFARRRFPLRCNAYLAWWEVRGTTVSENIRERLARQLDTLSWPRAEEWKSCLKAIRLQDEKALSLRRNAQHLIGTDLPHKVRQELLTDLVAGRSILTGMRHQDGEREKITIDDLAGMEVDLGKSSLVGPTSVFFNVVVTERAAGDVATDGGAEPAIDVPPLVARPTPDTSTDQPPRRETGKSETKKFWRKLFERTQEIREEHPKLTGHPSRIVTKLMAEDRMDNDRNRRDSLIRGLNKRHRGWAG